MILVLNIGVFGAEPKTTMTEKKFGGHTVDELIELRSNPADGAKFYLALLEAAPELFARADEADVLEAFIEKMVSKLDAAASEAAARGEEGDAMQALVESLSDPAVEKIVGS